MIKWFFAPMIIMLAISPAAADNPTIPPQAGFDQRLSQTIPLDLVFRDEQGHPLRLGQLLKTGPAILVLAYYRCPNLCGLVLEGLAESLEPFTLKVGQAFQVIVVSIDPKETPAIAQAKKTQLQSRFPAAGIQPGWHFLTGQEPAIERLANSVGFRYVYDADIEQYAHAAGITLLTSQGRIAQYFQGVRFPARTLRLGLVEASEGRIGSSLDQALLLCYDYDPVTGRYSPVIMKILRLAGLVTAVLIGGLVIVMLLRERRHRLTDNAESVP